MRSIDWNQIQEGGSYPTVFTQRESGRGLIVLWSWRGDDRPGLSPAHLVDDPELQDAWETAREQVCRRFSVDIPGLEVLPSQQTELADSGIRLAGNSLGLAFLLAALCRLGQRPWPRHTIAWGALLPVRNGTHIVFPVSDIENKLSAAIAAGATTVIHPTGEPILTGKVSWLEAPRTVTETLPFLVNYLGLELS